MSMVAAGLEPILIIDDDKSICKTLQLHFECMGYEVSMRHTGEEGLEMLEDFDSGIIILDLHLPDATGIEVLDRIKHTDGRFYSIIITAFPDMESTVKAVQGGVGEYIYKPIDIQELDKAITKGVEFLSGIGHAVSTLIPIPKYDSMKPQFIGKSQAMKEIFKAVGMVSMTKTTVHIMGDSGTGKELIARAIHKNSPYADEPFIPINCSAIVDTLLESELFGHEKGAFTGAVSRKEGKFSLAGRGVIFLDEIGEMDITLQAKLLRVLQEREFEMVGGKDTLISHCRIISATNRDLSKMVRAGTFREDLYYRLKVINIHLPPLNDHREDIPELALFFIARSSKDSGRKITHITQNAIDFLVGANWTGNIRELQNIITNAVVMSGSSQITLDVLKSIVKPAQGLAHADEDDDGIDISAVPKETLYRPRSLNEIEKEQIDLALNYTGWHKGKTCDILGLTRPRLERKIRKYNLKSRNPQSTHFGGVQTNGLIRPPGIDS